jgi:orotate phosphoribosyltransferase
MARRAALDIFREHRALLEGHFELASGLHSDTYLQCALVLQHPRVAARLCRMLAKPWQGEKVDVVVGPAAGGIILSYEMARQLGARALFMERVEGKLTLRRAFSIAEGEKVLVAEDVMTTGGSVVEVLEAVRRTGGDIVGVACLVDRGGLPRVATPSGGQAASVRREVGYQTAAILTLNLPTYKPEECPLCRKGIPIQKPGMKGVSGPDQGRRRKDEGT